MAGRRNPTASSKKTKQGKERDKGWACDLLPKPLIVAAYFAADQAAIDALNTSSKLRPARSPSWKKNYGGDEGFLAFDKMNIAAVKDRIREIKDDGEEKVSR